MVVILFTKQHCGAFHVHPLKNLLTLLHQVFRSLQVVFLVDVYCVNQLSLNSLLWFLFNGLCKMVHFLDKVCLRSHKRVNQARLAELHKLKPKLFGCRSDTVGVSIGACLELNHKFFYGLHCLRTEHGWLLDHLTAIPKILAVAKGRPFALFARCFSIGFKQSRHRIFDWIFRAAAIWHHLFRGDYF